MLDWPTVRARMLHRLPWLAIAAIKQSVGGTDASRLALARCGDRNQSHEGGRGMSARKLFQRPFLLYCRPRLGAFWTAGTGTLSTSRSHATYSFLIAPIMHVELERLDGRAECRKISLTMIRQKHLRTIAVTD